MELWDAIYYGVAQFAGATAGVVIATLILHGAPGNPMIRYAATLPGIYGMGVAFIAEMAISCALMLTVLFASNHKILSRYTPYLVGTLYAIFITLEAPLSGMSMNPARTFGSAFEVATGMPFGSISWPQLSACSSLRSSFCGCAAASAPTAPNSITPMTGAVFSAMGRSWFDLKESIKQQSRQPPRIGPV
jgi:hypothetical protein